LGKYLGRQAFGAVATIGLLRHFEDQFGHAVIIAPPA
jgi:hypothetical protein